MIGIEPELKCKFNEIGIICDAQTLCTFCGWNPIENERRIRKLRELAAEDKPLRLRVKRCVV